MKYDILDLVYISGFSSIFVSGHSHHSQVLNKCSINNGGCSSTCINNNNGTYQCTCPRGYHIGADGHICVDVDECFTNVNNCTQQCVNTIGSYKCLCYDGYELDDYGACKDKNECYPRINPCSHGCKNYPGSYQCQCPNGYALKEDRITCQDVNECDVYNGGCSDICTNYRGTYRCSCYHGYKLLHDKHMCGRLDACIHVSCHNGTDCFDTQHGFLCNCSTPHFAGRFCHQVMMSALSSTIQQRSSADILLLSILSIWRCVIG